MERLIRELVNIKEHYSDIIEEELYGFLNYENEYRDLTKQEVDKINKIRKNMFYLYKGIEYLDKIEGAE